MIRFIFFLLFSLVSISSFSQKNDSIANSVREEKSAQNLYNNGKYLSAIKKYKEALAWVSNSNTEKRVRLNYLIGSSFQQSRALDSAALYYERGDDFIQDSSSFLLKSLKHHYKSSLFFTQSEIDSAMSFALKSNEFALKSNNLKRQRRSISAIGNLFLLQKDFLNAQKYLRNSLEMAISDNDSLDIASTLTKLGHLQIEKGKYEEASLTLQKAADIFGILDNKRGVFIAKSFMVKKYFINGEFDKILKLTGDINSLTSKMEFSGKTKKLVSNLNDLVELSKNESINDTIVKEAEIIIMDNEKITESNNPQVNLEQKKAIVKYSQEKKKLDFKTDSGLGQAEIFDSTMKLQDSIYQAGLVSKYAELEMQYRVKEKENRNLLLENKNASQQLLIAKENSLKVIFGSIALLSIIAFSILYLYTKQRKQRLIWGSQIAIAKARQEEHNIIGSELHDNKANELALIAKELKELGNNKLSNNVDAIREDIRKLSHELTQVDFKESEFDEQLITLATKYDSESFKIIINNSKQISWADVDATIKRNLFLVIRESISNAYRHSEASKFVIEFERTKSELHVCIKDNGTGFEQENVSNGIGLSNIKMRVKEINGKISIKSLKGNGTNININIALV